MENKIREIEPNRKKQIMEPNKDTIIELIAKGNLEQAISETLNLTKQKHLQAHKHTTIISCRYHTLWRDIIMGVASAEEKETAINKVAASLYDILVKIPDTS